MSRIIVKNLPDKITKEKLLQLFSEKGVVTDIQLKFTKDGRFRKFAFIGFQKPESAEAAKESLNKSFINTSQIQIETCAELGDPNKPRPWSKYAPENSTAKKRKQEEVVNESDKKATKSKKKEKEKIRDPKIIELLKSHENDTLFTEFLEVNDSEVPTNLYQTNEDQNEYVESKDSEEDVTNLLATKDISDSEYLKLKTGKNINIKNESVDTNETSVKSGKKVKSIELFTIKLSGLPFKVKKSQIREFLSPVKPFTVRRALKIRGVAYCGFKTEKEMKISLLKNRSFLGGKRIYVTQIKQKNSTSDNEVDQKWKEETERLKGLETVAESGRIFIRNLPYTTTEDDLKELFEKYGPISEFILPIDSFTRKPKGFAIVTFLIPEHACKCFNELDGTIFQGRMLHLLPALPNKADAKDEDDNSGDNFKAKKLKKEKAKSGSSVNWNTFFIGENALAEAMAATYNTTKENVLDDKQGGVAVRLALGETQVINKMKEFLEENDVCLEAFENMSVCPRSKTVILVKNLPFGTKSEEIREIFCKFGVLKKVVVSPSAVAGLVEFIEPSEAKIAFRRLSYSKFKHVPMYLEWAPDKVFRKKETSDNKEENIVENKDIKNEESTGEDVAQNEEERKEVPHTPVDGAIIFVKNLNFKTEDEALRKHFSQCGTVVSATIARKKSPDQPGKKLSMGYGFVEYTTKEDADKALRTLQFSNLDDHKIELKRSNRTVASEVNIRKAVTKTSEKPSTKILVRNIPFQATQKEVTDIFKVFGEIKAVRLPKKMVGTGSHRGFCFVEYNTIHDAKRAFKTLSESTHLYGRRLVLEWAAADDDVATLREKTAQQFKAGSTKGTEKKKNITIEEGSEEE